MASQKQIIDIPLGVGLDFDKTEEGISIDSSYKAENVRFNKQGQLQKRESFEEEISSLVDSPIAVSSIKNGNTSELIVIDENLKTNTYLEAHDSWDVKDNALPLVDCEVTNIGQTLTRRVAPNGQPAALSLALLENYLVSSYLNYNGSQEYDIVVKVLDKVSKTEITRQTYSSNSAVRPRVKVFAQPNSDFILIIYVTYNTISTQWELHFDKFSTVTETFAGPTTLFTNVDVQVPFDAAVHYLSGVEDWFAVIVKDGGVMKVGCYNKDGTLQGTYSTAIVPSYSLSICASSYGVNSYFYILYIHTNGGTDYVDTARLVPNSTLSDGPHTIESYAGARFPTQASICADSSSTAVFYADRESILENYITLKATGYSHGAPSAGTIFAHNLYIYIKPLFTNSKVITLFYSKDPRSIVYYNFTDGKIVSTFNVDREVGSSAGDIIDTSSDSTFGDFIFPVAAQNLEFVNSYVLNLYDYRSSSIDHKSLVTKKSFLDKSLYFAGGQLSVFDGNDIYDYGFNQYPNLALTASNSTGSLADGDYGVAAHYFWYDGRGNLHRSPVAYDTINVDAGASEDTITVKVTNITATNKTDIYIALYLTAPDGTIYYVQNEIYENDPTSATQSITVEGVTTTSAQIFTTGGVIAPDVSYLAKEIFIHRDYAFLVRQEEPYSLYVSKPLESGIAPEFSSFLAYKLHNAELGEIVSVQELNTTYVIFREHDISILNGQGPTALGTGGFNITSLGLGVGADNNSKVTVFKDGIMFFYKNKPKILTKGFQIADVPLPTDLVSDSEWSPRASIVSPKTEEIMLLDAVNDDTYWFNYKYYKWSKGSGAYNDAVVHEDDIIVADTDSDDDSVKTLTVDGNAFSHTATFSTPWINLASLSGLNRIKRFSLKGVYRTYQTLTVNVYTDYSIPDSAPDQVFTIESADYQETADGIFYFTGHLAKQKCSSIRFEIISGAAGRGIDLSTLSLEVMVKRGMRRKEY